MDISKLTFSVFTLLSDETGFCFAGYHDPAVTWNGWICPYIYQHEVEKMRVVWGKDPDMELQRAIDECKMPEDSDFLPIGYQSWCWVEAPMGLGREYFLDRITSRDDAEAFILLLEKDGLMWHFDDRPDTVINGQTNSPLFTDAEAAAADCRAYELREVMGDPFGLPVALTNAEGGVVLRLEHLSPNGVTLEKDMGVEYHTLESLVDEYPDMKASLESICQQAVGKPGTQTGAEQGVYQITRLQ